MSGRTLGRLWARYLRVRDDLASARGLSSLERRTAERELKGLKDRLVFNYSPLVRYVVGRVLGRVGAAPVNREDALSWGTVGLLDAVETYDPARGTKFESYAVSKIRWSILDELRKADSLSRRLRRRSREVELATGELAHTLGRMPTEEEVARKLGVGLAEHRAFLVRCSQARVGSLEARLDYDGNAHPLVAQGRSADPEWAVETAEVRALLVDAIKTLGEQQRVVTTLYFYEGLTLREIGGALGLTEGRISQILHGALRRLRAALSESPRFSGGP